MSSSEDAGSAKRSRQPDAAGGAEKHSAEKRGVRFQIFNVTPLLKGALPTLSRKASPRELCNASLDSTHTSVLVYGRTLEGESIHVMLEMPMSFFVQVPSNWESRQVKAVAKVLGAFKTRLEHRIRFVYYTRHEKGNRDRSRPQKLPFARFFFRTEEAARNAFWKLSTKNGRRTDDSKWQDLLEEAGLNANIVRQQPNRHVFSAHDLTDPVRDFFYEVNRRLKLTTAKDNKCSMESWIELSDRTGFLSPKEFFARSSRNALITLKDIVHVDNELQAAPMVKMSFDIEQFSKLNPKSQARPFPKYWRVTDEIKNISCAIRVGNGDVRNVALCVGATAIDQQLGSVVQKKKTQEEEPAQSKPAQSKPAEAQPKKKKKAKKERSVKHKKKKKERSAKHKKKEHSPKHKKKKKRKAAPQESSLKKRDRSSGKEQADEAREEQEGAVDLDLVKQAEDDAFCAAMEAASDPRLAQQPNALPTAQQPTARSFGASVAAGMRTVQLGTGRGKPVLGPASWETEEFEVETREAAEEEGYIPPWQKVCCEHEEIALSSHLQPLQTTDEHARMPAHEEARGEAGGEAGVPVGVAAIPSDTVMFGPDGVKQNASLLKHRSKLVFDEASNDADSKTTPFPSDGVPRVTRHTSQGDLEQDAHMSAAAGAEQNTRSRGGQPSGQPGGQPGNKQAKVEFIPVGSSTSLPPTASDVRREMAASKAFAKAKLATEGVAPGVDPDIPVPCPEPGPVILAAGAATAGAATNEPQIQCFDASGDRTAAFADVDEFAAHDKSFESSSPSSSESEAGVQEEPPVHVVQPGEKYKVPDSNIEIWCFGRDDELILAFSDLISELGVDLLTGYNIISYDESAVFGRIYMYHMCKLFNFKTLLRIFRHAQQKMDEYAAIRKKYAKLTKMARTEIAELFDLPDAEYERCRDPPLLYTIMSNVLHFDRAVYDHFHSGPDVTRFFFHGKIPTRQITYREHMYDTSAHGQFMMKQWIGCNYAILCGWVMMKRSTFKFPSYTLKYVLNFFFKKNPEYHKIDLDYETMFQNMESGDPLKLGENAKYCCRDAEAVLYLLDKMSTELNMRQNGALMRTSVAVQTDCGMQRLVLNMLQGELEKFYVINNFVAVVFEYEGATVIVPLAGFYMYPVATLDYKSLYPSIMIAGNMGPGTLLEPRHDGKKPRAAKGVRTRTWKIDDTNSATFVQNEPGSTAYGIIPKLLKRLLGARDAVKKQMKAAFGAGNIFQGSMLNSKQLAIKISCNSVYGFFGVKVGYFPMTPIAASVTSWGRDIITGKTKRAIEEATPWKVIYGDSVTGDTTIYVRLRDGTRSCSSFFAFEHSLRRLGHFPRVEKGKLVWTLGGDAGIEVWNDTGWTRLRKFIKHRTRKPIVRVTTRSGSVDCTEDHSLVTHANDEISPLQARVNRTRLLTSSFAALVRDLEYPDLVQRYDNADKAFDAGKNIDRDAWQPHYHWRHLPRSDLSKAFLDGLVSGGFAQVREDVICFVDEHFAKGDLTTLFIMAVRSGLTPATEFGGGGGHADTVLSVERVEQQQQQRLGDDEEIDVYDLETENHHFAVGPGNLVVHNTDSVMVLLKGLNMAEAWKEAIRLADWVTDDVLGDFKSLVLEAEKVSKWYLMIKKKNYLSAISENPKDPEDLSLDYKGIELKRRDKTKVVKEMLSVAWTMLPLERGKTRADADPAVTGPIVCKVIQEWLWKIIRNELSLEYYQTSQGSKITYKKTRPGHMLVFDRHNQRVEAGLQKALMWDAGKRVPYVVLLGTTVKRGVTRILYGSKEISGRMEEPEWIQTWNSTPGRKKKDMMHVDRVYYIGLCANAVIRMLPFHLPHVNEMFDFAILEVEKQINRMRSIQCYFGDEPDMPTGLPRKEDKDRAKRRSLQATLHKAAKQKKKEGNAAAKKKKKTGEATGVTPSKKKKTTPIKKKKKKKEEKAGEAASGQKTSKPAKRKRGGNASALDSYFGGGGAVRAMSPEDQAKAKAKAAAISASIAKAGWAKRPSSKSKTPHKSKTGASKVKKPRSEDGTKKSTKKPRKVKLSRRSRVKGVSKSMTDFFGKLK